HLEEPDLAVADVPAVVEVDADGDSRHDVQARRSRNRVPLQRTTTIDPNADHLLKSSDETMAASDRPHAAPLPARVVLPHPKAPPARPAGAPNASRIQRSHSYRCEGVREGADSAIPDICSAETAGGVAAASTSLTICSNLSKNWPASIFAVESMRREPS